MHLRFRTITTDDLSMILTWRTDPGITQYMYTDVEYDLEKQRQWFRGISSDSRRLDWIINVDGEDVGLVSILRIDPVHQRCEWAYYLASPSVRGKGVGKNVELNVLAYVFETLKLNKLCCEVFAFNELVIKIHEKYGSRVEGNRRQHILKNGQFHDVVEMGILRSEWESNIKERIPFVRADIDPLEKEASSA